jgi:DNA polymerase I-like protein with 3'-5' exonuclease and polymerase domains
MNKSYVTVTTPETVKEMLRHILDHDIIAVDTETTSLNPRKGKIVGWSISAAEGEGYYLPTLLYNPDTDSIVDAKIDGHFAHDISITLIKKLVGKQLVMHNASFDCRYIENYFGIDLLPSLWVETQLLVHTVQEDGAFGYGNPFGLKSLAIMNQEKLGLNMEEEANKEQVELKESIHANGGKTTKQQYEIWKADLDILSKYASADTDLTTRICNLYLPTLKEEGLEEFFFQEEVMPLYKEVTVPMEKKGVALDLDLLRSTNKDIQGEILKNKQIVLDSLLSLTEVKLWALEKAIETFPVSHRGAFAQKLVEHFCIPLPQNEKGRYSITKKSLEALGGNLFGGTLPEKIINIIEFLKTGDQETIKDIDLRIIHLLLWKEKNDGVSINIQSKMHLGEIVFDYLGEEAQTTTDKGKAKFDMSMLKELSKKYEWAENLRVYNKLVKIKSTYIDRFLDAEEDGRYYFYYKQNGTVSGRYGSDAQQLPKPMEEGDDAPVVMYYTNLVRKFMISGKGRKFIDCDYTSLEPHVFASVSGEEGIQEIFNNGEDFYSKIAIRTEKIDGVSASKKDDNYLGKVYPARRQKAKAYSLGIPYGMSGYALAMNLDIPKKEAQTLVDGYLGGFPKLAKWMKDSREFAQEHGFIKNKIGRIRHLPNLKKIHDAFQDQILNWKFKKGLEQQYGVERVTNWYRDYKNGRNNCINFQIQSLAAGIVNRSAININRELKKRGIDGWVCAQIHDQLVVDVPEEHAEECRELVQYEMENVMELEGVTLKAPAEIADNFYDGH